MLFNYQALNENGQPTSGAVNAQNQELALVSLQRRGFTVTSIRSAEKGSGILNMRFTFLESASNRDVVFLSRELATLFEAQVSALRVFQLLSQQMEKPLLRETLIGVADDIQAGEALSKALAKHPKVFSNFYVNMVRAGEETGKLDQTFVFLADYLERSFELTSKAKNALIYPAFVLLTFVGVLSLMLTVVIPKIRPIIEQSGTSIPLFTQIVLDLSQFMIDYGVFLLVFLIIGGFFLFRWVKTEGGSTAFDRLKIEMPIMKNLARKLYLARIADNIHAMLGSGIAVVRALDITASVVGNKVYEDILRHASEDVKAGTSLSAAFGKYPDEIPAILTQMIQVGEETGEVASILERLSKFYQREVNSAVDTLVNLIEPLLIVALAVGVGFLLAAILLPIYNIANTI
jgi:type IV pilus assembly protein PilC